MQAQRQKWKIWMWNSHLLTYFFFHFQRVREEPSSMMQIPWCFGFLSLYCWSDQSCSDAITLLLRYSFVCGIPRNQQIYKKSLCRIHSHGGQFQPGLREAGNTFLCRCRMARQQSHLMSEFCPPNPPGIS